MEISKIKIWLLNFFKNCTLWADTIGEINILVGRNLLQHEEVNTENKSKKYIHIKEW
jgi:hypothetical protein